MTLIGSAGPIVEKSELGLALIAGENPLLTSGPDDFQRLLHFVAERIPPMSRAARAYLGAERYARRDALALVWDGWLTPATTEGCPESLESIKTPALVIQGDRDRVIHPATGKALAARLPNARLDLLEGVGHLPMMEKPKEIAALVDRFVASVTRSRRGTGYLNQRTPDRCRSMRHGQAAGYAAIAVLVWGCSSSGGVATSSDSGAGSGAPCQKSVYNCGCGNPAPSRAAPLRNAARPISRALRPHAATGAGPSLVRMRQLRVLDRSIRGSAGELLSLSGPLRLSPEEAKGDEGDGATAWRTCLARGFGNAFFSPRRRPSHKG